MPVSFGRQPLWGGSEQGVSGLGCGVVSVFLRALVGGAGSTILLSFLESISHRYRQTPAWVLAVDLRPAFGQALL
ncbi:hypothetical protein [Rhodococcus erythropolis]|uniref:hypothetical protein n=1 Tax=Rhodococcus erythropolis TaxID=1833 RepID=UPI00188530AC|nr:hypothetical protein [Rhodococcus erythropolis]